MKTQTKILLIIFFLISVSIKSQNAPVTTAGIVIDATTAPGAVTIPITVRNFVSIGYFKLTLRYQADQVTYTGASVHSSFPDISITNIVAGPFSKIIITWPQTAGGVTLPDDTHLLDLVFTYHSSASPLNWFYYGTDTCRYKKYSGGSFIALNDSPKASYYIDGAISNRAAPVAYAPLLTNPMPGSLAAPVTVNNFTSIAAMTLTLEFNQSVLTYTGCTPNPSLGGVFNAGTMVGSNGKMRLTVSWFGLASLSSGSTLFTANFNYSGSNGSCSSLDWYDDGSSCEYVDAAGNSLPDSPTANYYRNGAVLNQYSPRVWLPVITDAVPSGPVSLPLFVNDFNNIWSFSLAFEYDAAAMTYASFTAGNDFANEITLADSQSGSKRKIVLSWTGTSNKTLPEGSLLATLNFTYNTGTSPLTWILSGGSSCRFNDSGGNASYDFPKTTYYKDGLVASHIAPQSALSSRQAAGNGQQVTVPLNVYNFTNIGQFSYTLNFDPAVLTYVSASLIPPIGGSFSSSAVGQGMVLIDWSGTTTSLPDSTDLVSITFIYNSGSTPVAFYDDGNSCRFAESSPGTSLYDLPGTFYYVNGYVGPQPLVADFTAGAPGRSYDTTVVLNDMTIGGPTSWSWSISPSSCYFANGTTSASQNPQVRFTSNGAYTVTLIVNRGNSSSIRIRTDYMYIGTPGLWTGITSGDWNLGSNWHNFKVPETSLSIVIPSTAPNWPHLAGDLTIGTFCQDITMENAANLYIDGDLNINAGSSLVFTGPGNIFLGGNWLNSGIFAPGTGTIEFTGPDDSAILVGSSVETFYMIRLSKTNAKLSVIGNVHVTGTESP